MSTDKKEYGISVIIPCYNVEKYVEQTLESVLNQSFKDYEIICLNDGSTDTTLEILNKYENLYSNIRAFTGENHGLSYQRNMGIQRAQGRYIYYLDSDDLIKENCLETLYQYAETDSLDILYFEADSFYESKEIEESFPQFLTLYHRYKKYEGVYNGRDLYIQMENAGDIKMQVGLQFVRRQFLIDNNIEFGREKYFEDNLYTVRTMLKAARARCVRDNLYLRRVRGNSIMTGGKRKIRFESYLEVVSGLMQILEDEKQNSALQEAIYKRIRGTYINIFKDYLKVPESEREELFGEKNSPLYFLIGMAFFINIEEINRKELSGKLKKAYEEKSEINAKLQKTYEEKSELNAKLQKTYEEKSELNAKLQKTYAEKSEINAKLKKTHEEKAERGEKIKKLQKKLKKQREELDKKSREITEMENERDNIERHFLGRIVHNIYKD